MPASIPPPKSKAPATLNSIHDAMGSGSFERGDRRRLRNVLLDFQMTSIEVAQTNDRPRKDAEGERPSLLTFR